MLRHAAPGLVSTLPLVLLGSLPLDSFAGELFFPVLQESGAHWFSWFDPAYTDHALNHREFFSTDSFPPSVQKNMAEYELALESGAPLRDAYGGSQIEILGQLSRYYREQGRYAEAFERLERQYFLARVSHGLYNARHVPVLQELADLALLKGDPHRSQELRLALLNLQMRAFAEDDPRRTEALLSWAEWHLQRFIETASDLRHVAAPDARLLSLQHFVESDDYFRRAFVHYRPDAADAVHRSLLQAVLKWQTLHIVAFRTQQFPLNHPHQDPLGQAQAIDQLLVPRPRPSDVSAFLRQLLQHDQTTTGPEAELHALKLLQLGDWQHALGISGAAAKTYEEAVASMKAAGLSSARIGQLLMPGLPIPDPEHWYHFNSHSPNFRGHLDVDVKLDRYGNLLQATLADPALQDTPRGKAVLQQANNSQFRPPLTSTGARKTYRLRYYHE